MDNIRKRSNSKDEKIANLIKETAASFLQKESNRTSLLTVTKVELSKDGKGATIFFTVLPDNKQKEALDFTKRLRPEFKDYFLDKVRIGRVPFFDFAIDLGEKHRQKIDDISQTL